MSQVIVQLIMVVEGRGCKNYSAVTEPTVKEMVADVKKHCIHPLSFCLIHHPSADVILLESDKVIF